MRAREPAACVGGALAPGHLLFPPPPSPLSTAVNLQVFRSLSFELPQRLLVNFLGGIKTLCPFRRQRRRPRSSCHVLASSLGADGASEEVFHEPATTASRPVPAPWGGCRPHRPEVGLGPMTSPAWRGPCARVLRGVTTSLWR